MPSKIRLERIADRIRQDLSEMIVQRVSDPRLANVNITDVKVDRELAFADVYVSSFEGVDAAPEILAGLNHASGFLRSQLAAQIELRTIPRLRFHWDPTPEHADKMERLFEQIKQETTDTEETSRHGS